MAAQLPVVFRSGMGDSRFSFDWFDYAAGAGYQRFYAAGAWHSGGAVRFLTTQTATDPDDVNGARYSAGASVDVDFDITFNNPVTIAAADSIVNLTSYQQSAGNTSFVVNVYHVTSGGTETSLGTITSGNTDAGALGYIRRCARVTLTSKSFAVGEKLRLNIIYSGCGENSNIIHDPNSRQTVTEAGSGLTIKTSLTFDVPFKVDI